MSKLFIDGKSYDTLVAINSSEQKRGLMNASYPPPIMSFPYKTAQPRKFWMKNCSNHLDIIFCFGGKIVYIDHGQPFNVADVVGNGEPSNLVIEAPFGFADYNDICVGSLVRLQYSKYHLIKMIKEGTL